MKNALIELKKRVSTKDVFAIYAIALADVAILCTIIAVIASLA